MKLLFITTVAAFLLYSVVADRTGPSNVLTPSRRLSSSGHGIERRRSWSRNSRVTRVSSTPKTLHGKFPGTTTLGVPLKNARFPKNQRPDVRGRRRSSLPEFRQTRRSHHPPAVEFDDDNIFFEPVISHSRSDHKMGPLVGPLNLPGIGKSVYIRLPVPPDEETSSHVTLHLMSSGPVETVHDIHDHGDFVHDSQRPETPFRHTKPRTFAPIRPEEVQNVDEESSRFVDTPMNHLDFTPSNIKAFEYFEAQRHSRNMKHLPTRFIDNQPQYLASPNHHELPIAFRPVENLINLPNYPPLSTGSESNVEKEDDNDDNVEATAQGQNDIETVSDAQQSASFKHTRASPRFTNFSPAWNPVSVLGSRRSEVTVNRRESSGSEFMPEIRAPDLRFAKGFSIETRGKSKNATVHPNSGENGFKADATTIASTSTTSEEVVSTTTATSSPILEKGTKKKKN